jgi:xylulokinase
VPAALAAARASTGLRAEDVLAICADGHGPTLVAAAADGAPLASLAWSDGRARAAADELVAATGLGSWAVSILPAALWLERHDADAAAEARWYLNSWEWLALRLSGEARRTRSAGQALVDPLSAPVARLLDPARTPPTVDAGTIVGELTRDASAALGLRAGTPVVAGLNDAFASCLGVGLLESGDAYDAGGSAGGFAVYTDRPVEVPGAFAGAAPIPDRWYVGAVMAATGRSLDWFASVAGVSSAALLDEAAAVPPGADGLVFLPYLAGERSPVWDPRARGAFVGLTLRHGRPQMARAVVESAALALRHVSEPIVSAGVRVAEMRVAGRPASNDAWNRIKCDVTRFPVAVPAVRESAVLGAAILAAIGVGREPDLPTAVRAMVRIADRLAPDPAVRALYDRLYEVYCSLGPRLADASHELGGLA